MDPLSLLSQGYWVESWVWLVPSRVIICANHFTFLPKKNSIVFSKYSTFVMKKNSQFTPQQAKDKFLKKILRYAFILILISVIYLKSYLPGFVYFIIVLSLTYGLARSEEHTSELQSRGH